MSHTYPSQVMDRVNIRLPDGVREKVKAIAAHNRRSMNAEIVFAIERHLGALDSDGAYEFGHHGPVAATRTDALQGVDPTTQG
ncbi:hypothetical protein FHS82_001069 [Pseudochelatococcus lubricantis]|uniref:Arc-like DNA binding domain-containing protein n=1 Tax=Pseudochelatococcus lubricantis TaxID=1538102 RepID=A0ABX0UWB3_9HYPH|nr:Arc family DNA-binding protein [Pseudochelatococcus lubricantis]NIJ57243.1 hypothetical protein [Pseudochelatococcus lubricantis]